MIWTYKFTGTSWNDTKYHYSVCKFFSGIVSDAFLMTRNHSQPCKCNISISMLRAAIAILPLRYWVMLPPLRQVHYYICQCIKMWEKLDLQQIIRIRQTRRPRVPITAISGKMNIPDFVGSLTVTCQWCWPKTNYSEMLPCGTGHIILNILQRWMPWSVDNVMSQMT